ncbi:MAG: VWA domain-containing protein [Candidatus Babeliales bacterium]
MNSFFWFKHPWIAIGGIFFVIFLALIRWFWYKPIMLSYSLTSALKKTEQKTSIIFKVVPFLLRAALLYSLVLFLARPQLVNVKSKVQTEGIDIMMVLDASGSMQCFDDVRDRRSRFEVAKKEAISFIEQRENDQIGLVIFGKDAISRCPLTLDKHILTEIIDKLELGMIDPDGTVLSIAICMAAKRLKNAKAKSKVMIVLTDGEPTLGLDLQPQLAINLVKKLGIKVYTIGIGNEQGGFWHDPLFGIRPMGFRLNTALLQEIAGNTGGQFYLAEKPEDMKRIYNTINQLEKTEYEAPIFTQYTDLVLPFALMALGIFLIELLVTSFVWFSI